MKKNVTSSKLKLCSYWN